MIFRHFSKAGIAEHAEDIKNWAALFDGTKNSDVTLWYRTSLDEFRWPKRYSFVLCYEIKLRLFLYLSAVTFFKNRTVLWKFRGLNLPKFNWDIVETLLQENVLNLYKFDDFFDIVSKPVQKISSWLSSFSFFFFVAPDMSSK